MKPVISFISNLLFDLKGIMFYLFSYGDVKQTWPDNFPYKCEWNVNEGNDQVISMRFQSIDIIPFFFKSNKTKL